MVIDISNLLAFAAVADWPRMADAADHLNLSQPAVSKRLSELERRLGYPLFDRVNRELVLTEAGRLLLAESRGLLAEHARLERFARAMADGEKGQLRLATSHHIGLHHLPPVLRAYRKAHSGVEPRIQFLDSEAAHEAVSRGDVDLALVTLDPSWTGRLASTQLWHDDLCGFVDQSHPLAGGGDPAEHMAILPERGTYTRDLIEASLPFRLHQVLPTNYLETIGAMIDAGLGWSVLPAGLQRDNWARLPLPPMARELGVIYDPKRHLGASARGFLAALDSAANTAT
ncbi:LysR family transcriptional regulator [Litorivicinus lipolyticus]|uniref:LysR family transcriptional regulator n=1 Tax=Litorivicinus lipolyticus TaxID=418701 RepID=A0A5Q2QD13_9GAMM|nr:LysR family transcriptional regulator [Litorivicinus lipolyticus]QGG79730.1 LysR family transcriptional regulator [Litorivicinus lipolyticus]